MEKIKKLAAQKWLQGNILEKKLKEIFSPEEIKDLKFGKQLVEDMFAELQQKPKLLLITGTPGTGKSALARVLAKKLGYERLDLHHHYKSISSGYNKKKQAYDIDQKKFIALVKKKLSHTTKGLILDSHLSHLLPQKIVNLCIVLTCSNLKALQKRLQKRKYSRAKIRENLDAEIFQVCLTEAREQGHRIIILDTAKRSPATILRAISKSL